MIIDCFTFYNELDVLDIRLAELYPVVDSFVLVEATHTHKGEEKPLYYAQNRQRFAPYNDKIRHIVVGDLPGGPSQAAIWRREIGQRQAIARALVGEPDDALVLISDLDEIPRRECVAHLRGRVPDDMVITFDQTLYYYNVNTQCTSLRWNGTRATHLSNVRALTPDGVRWETLKQRSNEYPRHARFPNSGWHLSYFGDVAHIQKKMRAFLHQELVSDEAFDADTIARRMVEGIDVWGREDAQRFEIGAAPDLPWAMRVDPGLYSSFFHPDWRPTFHEDWFSANQAHHLGTVAQMAPEGAVVEIGCWEGRSTVALAQSVNPRVVHCVDHWRGNPDEGAGHPATAAAGERDVRATFERNMALLTAGNVQVHVADWREWASAWSDPIAFLHLDAAHDYESVRECLEALRPRFVPGALVIGDDLYADGVYRAVHDVFGQVQDISGRMWVWENKPS